MFKRRRSVAGFFFKIILFFLFITAIIFTYIEHNYRPTILAIAEAKVIQIATDSVHSAIRNQIVDKNVRYQDLIQLHKDSKGEIVMLQANTVKINQVAADIALAVEETLENLQHTDFAIPLGQVLGSHLLAAYGPQVHISVIPVGAVKVDVLGEFEEAGINQTRHKIYLTMNTTVKVVVPMTSAEVELSTVVPVTENILLGNVPDVYVNFPGGFLGTGMK